MSEENETEALERAVARVRRRLGKRGQLRRQEVRRACGADRELADQAALALIEAGVAVRVEAMHGSWRLQVPGYAEPQQRRETRENLGRYASCTDSTAVAYTLVDRVLDCGGDMDRIFAETRSAVARLELLRQTDRDRVAVETMQRLRRARGVSL